MKNILILSDAFPPAFNPRMGFLCKYLPEHGWNPTIITEYTPQNIFNNLTNLHNTNYINFYWNKNGKLNKLKYILVFLSDFFFNYKDFIFTKNAAKVIKSNDISMILASVSWRAFPATTAKILSEKFNIPYIIDCRDIYEQFPNYEYTSKNFLKSSFINKATAILIQNKYKRQRDKILRKANAVTTVSQWHTQKLSELNKNAHLIFNGFDSETFYFKTITSSIFKITYTGRIESEAIKDPSLLFETVAIMSKQNIISPNNFRVQFYLLNQTSKDIIKKMREKYGIEIYVDIFDGVPNEEVPAILNESSILLLLANSSVGDKTPKGIMGTKIFEFLAVEKPILCVRNDQSCLEETINNTKSGISASTTEEVSGFILEKYAEWKKNGFTHQTVDKQSIEIFSRKYQSKQFVKLFEKLC
ncbi:MAG: glycosyltransferase [Marinilabiliaceae bacterium]|nr:glycosyltransferase [Marinilabiliaceae bacterium]